MSGGVSVVCLFMIRCVAVIPAYSDRLRLSLCVVRPRALTSGGEAQKGGGTNQSASKRAALHRNRMDIRCVGSFVVVHVSVLCELCPRVSVDRLRVQYISDASALTSGCQVRTNEELVPRSQMDLVSLMGVMFVETWVDYLSGGE